METKRYQWGNLNYEFYTAPITLKQKSLAVLVGSIGLIIPDGSVSLIMSSCILSPIGFKKSLKNKVETFKEKLIRIKYRYLI